ncbi:MAG TPA: response regulator transcription factor [Bacillota bacterium]|nr:response regulator transcription factor [Bacillota bacterium]
MMPKILIIEDEIKIQQIVRAYLEKEGLEVYTASDGAQGLELIKNSKPDLLILDLMLPGIPGEQLLTELRQISDIPVIILSAKSSVDERIFGLNIGADDYLTKPFSPRELVARVYAHLRRLKSTNPGSSASSTASFNQRDLVIDSGKYEVLVKGKPVNLTPTEFKLLQLLSQTPGQVFSRSQLVEQIQGYNYDGFDRTIDSHIKNLRQKIEPGSEAPVYILTVFGVGYKFGGERDV